jgi:flagellin-like hook-associated protein FlgL
MAYGSITLTAGMRQNLVSLQKTNNLMELTQTRLASGKKVNTALDDPVKFFAALGHNNRANDLSVRKSEMGEAIQTIKAANNGIEAITDLIESAKSTAQSALAIDACTTTTSTNYIQISALAVQFDTLRSQIDDLATDAGYKGTNFLQQSTLVVDFHETANESTLSIVGFDGDTTGLTIDSAIALWSLDASVTSAIADMDTAKTTLRTKAQSLSNSLSTITTRQNFTTNMINTLEDGAADLVNADMNEEGANMLMLQTRQALGTTSLSLASQAAQNILRLF